MNGAQWFKGNIHTHTNESDGDEDPYKVVSWYRRHGYDFLVLSDHNHLTLLDYGGGRRRFRKPLMVPRGGQLRTNEAIRGAYNGGFTSGGTIDAGGVVPTRRRMWTR